MCGGFRFLFFNHNWEWPPTLPPVWTMLKKCTFLARRLPLLRRSLHECIAVILPVRALSIVASRIPPLFRLIRERSSKFGQFQVDAWHSLWLPAFIELTSCTLIQKIPSLIITTIILIITPSIIVTRDIHQPQHHPHPHLWQIAKKLLCTEVCFYYSDKGQSIRGSANCLTPEPIASLAPCSYIYSSPLCKSIFQLTMALWTNWCIQLKLAGLQTSVGNGFIMLPCRQITHRQGEQLLHLSALSPLDDVENEG